MGEDGSGCIMMGENDVKVCVKMSNERRAWVRMGKSGLRKVMVGKEKRMYVRNRRRECGLCGMWKQR